LSKSRTTTTKKKKKKKKNDQTPIGALFNHRTVYIHVVVVVGRLSRKTDFQLKKRGRGEREREEKKVSSLSRTCATGEHPVCNTTLPPVESPSNFA